MKKLFCVAIAACALLLSGCELNEMSSLRDISRPYAGEYKCTRLQLGNEDMLGSFESIKLKLGYFGDFALSYRDLSGIEGGYKGKYTLKEDRITFTSEARGEEKAFVFPYRKGTVEISYLFNEKPLIAEFKSN